MAIVIPLTECNKKTPGSVKPGVLKYHDGNNPADRIYAGLYQPPVFCLCYEKELYKEYDRQNTGESRYILLLPGKKFNNNI